MNHQPGCSAQDVYLVTGGLACGRCGSSSVPKVERSCPETTFDLKPCPILPDDGRERCWVHTILHARRP